jgi:hypothetical protein
MRRYFILILFLTGCDQYTSHESIQDAYSACGSYYGLKTLSIDSDSVTAVCGDGHMYTMPKHQIKIK